MNKFRTFLTEYWRLLVENYRRYWHRENAKLRAMRQQEQLNAEQTRARALYEWFSIYLRHAICRCASIVHFDIPKYPISLWSYRKWMKEDNQGKQFLVYRCHYHPGHGLQGENFQCVLESELKEIGAFWLWPEVPVSVELSPEYVAYIAIPLTPVVQIYKKMQGVFKQ